MPNEVPKYIAVYDNMGASYDQYTVVYRQIRDGLCHYATMCPDPFWPGGVFQHGSSPSPVDSPRYRHLGKKIRFEDLPAQCQRAVAKDYEEMWDLVSRERLVLRTLEAA